MNKNSMKIRQAYALQPEFIEHVICTTLFHLYNLFITTNLLGDLSPILQKKEGTVTKIKWPQTYKSHIAFIPQDLI